MINLINTKEAIKRINAEKHSLPVWILKNNIVNEKGKEFEFLKHKFLFDIVSDTSKVVVLKKAAQMGASVSYNLLAFYLAYNYGLSGIYCVDKKTQLLSKRGWLSYNDIKKNDEILTLSLENNQSQWTKIDELFIKEVDMKMISFEGRNFSALVTPNHRWAVSKRWKNKDKYFFETTNNLDKHEYFIPRKADIKLNNKKKYSDEYVALIGWIITEGCYKKYKDYLSDIIVITQSYKVNNEKVCEIRNILNKLNIDFKERKTSNGCINFSFKGKKIKKDFPKKTLTLDFIHLLTKEQLHILIDTIIAGDGWIDQWGTKNLIQKDKGFIDVFAMACVLAGYIPRINQRIKAKDKCWYVKLIQFDYVWTAGLNPQKVNYKGVVWCPRTKYGTFLARRNGHIYWTGNTMPSDTDVEEFSKTKTDKIFQSNKCIRSKLKLDNVSLKQIGNTFVYFKGTRSKSAPISTTADWLMHDEVDRSDLNIVETYESRISASDFKRRFYFSNPSLTNVGVDMYWKDSDKKEWFIRCDKCNEEQPLEWESNVNEIKGIYVCSKCNTELDDFVRMSGNWKPTARGDYSGYHISQMMASWLSAKDLIKVRERRGVEYFRNFVLGESYSVGEVTDFRQAVLDSWVGDPIDSKPFYMGVDIGRRKHWVLGSKKGIFKMGVCETREELESVIDRYNPTTVMDSGPERTWAEEFKKKYPKLYLCFYRRDKDKAEIISWGGEKGSFEDAKNIGYVWIDRNRLIDLVIYDLQKGEFLFNLKRDELEKMIEHWETMRRVKEDTSLGGERYVWESTTGENHFASALWFFYLARKKGEGVTDFLEDPKPKKKLIEVTSKGQKMVDLKEIMENE